MAKVLPLRHQAEVMDGWLAYRLDTVLPRLMEEEGFDTWVVVGREYNEDPVMKSLLPATMMYARRRTILVFHRTAGAGLEKLAFIRGGSRIGDLYTAGYQGANRDQWEALGEVLRVKDPRSIGINISETFAFGDGLTYTEHKALMKALGSVLANRTRSAERLAIRWLEHRTSQELDAYTGIVRIAHEIIDEAFSSEVVHPGVSTCADVSWWMRQRACDLSLSCWFQPDVESQRHGAGEIPQDVPIRPGDVLHCDFGLHYLGLATDTQHMAYVLHMGETCAPRGLIEALRLGNRLQDILAAECRAGRTGNQILASSLQKAKAEGLRPSVYTHPIGYHGHGAGPTIGLYDQQGGVPGRGDYELHDDTCHSMELNIVHAVPEWEGQDVRIALEQDIAFTGGQVHFLDQRQTDYHLIK